MSWDTSLNTGIVVVDAQHMKLIENVEAFAEACGKGAGHEYIDKTLNFLENYVVKHFATEEKIQQASNYPRYAEHKACHHDFVQDFLHFKDRIDEEGKSIEIMHKLNEFLIGWVIKHISSEDMAFGKYYSELHPDLAKSGI